VLNRVAVEGPQQGRQKASGTKLRKKPVCEVMSSEPDDGTGDGEFDGDVDGLDGYTAPVPIDLVYDPLTASFVGTVMLRAERDGADSGRTYSIICDVLDAAGHTATSSCVVVVPHDRRKK
jgi:hypothetical protein